jgi:hypothetical protein
MPVKAMQFRRFRANYRLRVETGASTALRAPNTHALQLR